MSALVAGVLTLVTDPSPNPTEGTLRPGLEEWQVSPGLIGFAAVFALALACVLLFLNMSKHLRRVGYNAREQGIPVPAPKGIGFRRQESDAASAGRSDGSAAGTPDAGSSPSGGSSSSGGDDGGGSGD